MDVVDSKMGGASTILTLGPCMTIGGPMVPTLIDRRTAEDFQFSLVQSHFGSFIVIKTAEREKRGDVVNRGRCCSSCCSPTDWTFACVTAHFLGRPEPFRSTNKQRKDVKRQDKQWDRDGEDKQNRRWTTEQPTPPTAETTGQITNDMVPSFALILEKMET